LAKKGMTSAFAAITARESEGVTKKLAPRIMLRSASPSAAAPNAGGDSGSGVVLPFLSRPIAAMSSTAWVRFGSACPWCFELGPPKSGSGVPLRRQVSGSPNSSQKILRAYGPCTPPIES
jgi:hypothetical protein